MCTGYWETCRCNDCEKAEEIERELEKMGYSV